MSKKRSQVTFFIIIAIFILVIFSISMIVVSNIGKKKITTAHTPIQGSVVDLKQFNLYMQLCLDSALKDSLFTIGRQGGFFFKGQEGSIIDFDINSKEYYITKNNITQSFNITYVNDKKLTSYILDPPDYPCVDGSLVPGFPPHLKDEQCANSYSHFFPNLDVIPWSRYQKVQIIGNKLKVPLCSRDMVVKRIVELGGPGSPTKTILQSVCNASRFNSDQRKYSIQNQTEEFLKYRLRQCYDDAKVFIADQMDAAVEYEGDFNVSVIFGDEYTTATLNFPLKLSYGKGETKTESLEYYARAKVRFRPIYALLYGNNLLVKDAYAGILRKFPTGIIDLDFRDIDFDIEIDSQEMLMNYSLFNLSISREYDTDGSGSIIKIVDTQSELFGKPYEYYVRMLNRRPALDYLSPSKIGIYDFYLYENQYLEFAPEAFDLDDEGKENRELRYYYEPDSSWSFRQDDFYNNAMYKKGESQGLLCVHSKYGLTKQMCTKFLLDSNDLGLHRVKIGVKDGGDLEDYQIVTILVDRYPNVSFKIANIYPDIPVYRTMGGKRHYIVSDEDPFIFNMSESNFSVSPGFDNRLSWNDTRYDKSFIDDVGSKFGYRDFFGKYKFYTTNTTFVHPGYDNFSNYSELAGFLEETAIPIQDTDSNDYVVSLLRQQPLKDYLTLYDINNEIGYPINLPASTNFEDRKSSIMLFYYKQGATEEVERDIFIAQCLPHRSNVPSYPYNLLRTLGDEREFNPYLANHTCCAGYPSGTLADWEIKPQDTTCYLLEEFGTYVEFMRSPNEKNNISLELFREMNDDFADGDALEPDVMLPSAPIVRYEGFDFYKRTLHGKCDGIRGNVCVPQEFSIKKIPYCGINMSKIGDLSNKTNNTIELTEVPNDDRYLNSSLCLCRNKLSMQWLMNKSNTTVDDHYNVPHNELSCCLDNNGVPTYVTNQSCIIMECAKNVRDDDMQNFTISDIQWDENDNTLMPPYCRCGNQVADNRTHADFMCCNHATGLYGIYKDLDCCRNPSSRPDCMP